MPQVVSKDGGSGVTMAYVSVGADNRPVYKLMQSLDGYNFNAAQNMTMTGLKFNGVDGSSQWGVSYAAPAFGFAQQGNDYVIVRVSESVGGSIWGRPTALSIYRIHKGAILIGSWQHVKTISCLR